MIEKILDPGEPHPMTHYALDYIKKNISPLIVESLASRALSGDRTSEICLSTLQRMDNGEPVSDRYLMGLAWFIYMMNNTEHARKNT